MSNDSTTEEKKRLEPWDELSDKSLKKVNILTEAAFQATNTKEVNLATDTIKVPGQNFACVSFVSPDSNQKNGSIGMKIRGVFDTREEATSYVQRLIRLDPMFDIYVCDMYNWCLVPPDPEHISDQTYQDETLHTIISEYRKNQIYAKEHFEERKRMMVEQAADEVRRSTLQKIQEESENQLNEGISKLSNDELHISANSNIDSRAVIDVTNLECSAIGEVGEITPSELMDQMVHGRCKETV